MSTLNPTPSETAQNEVIKIHIDELHVLKRRRDVNINTILRDLLQNYNVEILAMFSIVEYYDYIGVDYIPTSAKEYELVNEELAHWKRYEEKIDVVVERIKRRLEKKYNKNVIVVALCEHEEVRREVAYAFVMVREENEHT
jgi:hypothetical protein